MAKLSEEQVMLRDMAQTWTRNESPYGAWRKVRNAGETAGFDPAVYGQMAEMGWTGIVVPEAHGGSDFGWMSLGLVVQEISRTLTASPLVPSSLAAAAISMGGSDAQKAKWLPGIADGSVIGTLAVDEGPRHGGPINTSVSGSKLSGTKAFVAEGDTAHLFIVAAQDGVYIVDGSDAGISRSRRHMVDYRSHAFVTFDGAAAEKLEHGGDDLLDQLIGRARIITACEMFGMASEAFDVTLAYLKQRVQFNQVLATFQALQHRMAGLFSDIEITRSAIESALVALDSGADARLSGVLAKTRANDTLHVMSREAIQLHGGIGMTDEYDIGFVLKRARPLEAAWGNSAHLRDQFARMNGY
jgi:alkylation response protein AidB-like acyl-CoA dehydrogenase